MSPLRRAALLAVLAATGGCIDYLDPNLPQPGPPVADVAVHLLGNGFVSLEVAFAPGLSLAGDWRGVPDDTLRVDGVGLAPDSVFSDQTRKYVATLPVAAPAGPVTLRLPAVAGVAGAPPSLSWTGVRRLDGDTVALAAGAALHLHVSGPAGPQQPPVGDATWFLTLGTGEHFSQIGADGLPPADLRVPAELVPDSARVLFAALLVQFDGTLAAAGSAYVVTSRFDQHVYWTIVREESP
jgi:hypothetical protein